MSYPDLLKKLRDNHLYADLCVRVKSKEEIITGLSLNTSPLLKDRSLDRVREIVGPDFKADYLSSNESILITKAK